MFLPFPVIVRFTAALLILITPASLAAQEQLSNDSATIFINQTDTLYTKVDAKASYPGGTKAWAQFLNRTLRYPQEALDNEIMGETRVSFIVDVDGTVSDIKAVDGDPMLTAESVRVIQASGNWKPAAYQGQPIKSYRIQPIVYRLQIAGERRTRKRKG